MKNSTKVRLHLSKKLFESLTREIIKEAKANDGYTVAVKQPKAPKQVKEVNAVADTDKMKRMEGNVPTSTSTTSVQDMNMGNDGKPAIPGLKEKMSSKEKMAKGLYNEVDAEMDTDKMKKMHEMETDVAEGKMNSEFEKEILKVLKAKFDLDPTTATIDFGPNGMSIKPVNYQVWADKFTKGNQGRNGNYVDDKAQKIAAYFNKRYGKNLVAEEGQLNEIDPSMSWEAIAAGMAAIGLAPLAIDKMHQWWKKKHPKSFKAAQGISAAIDKSAGNTPGQGHGVDTSKTFGPQNEKQLSEFTGTETESSGAIAMIDTALVLGIPLSTALIKDLMKAKSPEEKKQLIQKKLADKSAGMDKGTDALKEYENDDYRVVNGQCRRYNDEHEYTVVSMSYCR